MNTHNTIRTILCLLTLLPLLGTGPVMSSGAGEHGWSIYRTRTDFLTLMHLPPRAGSNARNQTDALPGTVVAIRQLNTMPEALATSGRRVYLVFPPKETDERSFRRVSSGRTTNNTTGGWFFESASFFDAHPPLVGDGKLSGFVAPGGIMHALIETDQHWKLYRLAQSGWDTIELPNSSASEVMLLNWGERVAIITRQGTESNAMTLSTDDKTDEWESIAIKSLDLVWNAEFVLGNQDEIIVGVLNETGNLNIHVLRSSSDLVVHTLENPPKSSGAMVLEGSNTLVLLGRQPQSKSRSSSIRVIEIDLTTGRTLYDGEPVKRRLLNADSTRFILMMFFMMGSMGVLFSIHPSKWLVFELTDGYSIAHPSKRLMSMLIDLGILSVIIAPLMDVGILELFTGNVFSRPDSGWLALPILLVTGLIVSTIFESTLGATPGKLAMRIRVVPTESGAVGVLPVHRALLRNTIKWLLPPIAILGIIEPNHRTRADLIARAVVAMQVDSNKPKE
ncbi:MAG: RDD family protein [Phycisphaerales bacterium]|nr:RDD family protein [Phycisphaerales bacterium]